MSTFTDCNGPNESSFTGNNGPSTPGCVQPGSVKTYTELIEAYENLQSIVSEHIAEHAGATGVNPHGTKDYVKDVASTKQDKLVIQNSVTPDSTNPVQSGAIYTAIKQGLETKQDTLQYDTEPVEGSNKALTSGTVFTAIRQLITMLNNYQPKLTFDNVPIESSNNPVTSHGIWTAVKALTDELTAFTENFAVTKDIITANKVLTSTEGLLGKLHARELIDFTDWVTFSAQPVGLNTSHTTATSEAYIIGQLSNNWEDETSDEPLDIHGSKSCRVFIKYISTYSLDAIIDAVVTCDNLGKYHGTITAMVSRADDDWKDLAFHLMEGTDIKGNKSIYICISSSSLVYDHAEYPTFNFRACGINFIPPTAEGYISPVGSAEYKGTPIASVACGSLPSSTVAIHAATVNEVYVSKLFTTSGKEVFEIDENNNVVFNGTPYVKDEKGDIWPVLNGADMENVVPIGAGLRWVNMENVPNNFCAADGRTVNVEYAPHLAYIIPPDEQGNMTLPIEDHTIIRIN